MVILADMRDYRLRFSSYGKPHMTEELNGQRPVGRRMRENGNRMKQDLALRALNMAIALRQHGFMVRRRHWQRRCEVDMALFEYINGF